MAARGVLFICCSTQEAQAIRRQARADRRTVSGYVLAIVFRTIRMEERIFMLKNAMSSRRTLIRPRTAVLVRCSSEEADRVRAAAERHGETISGYVLLRLGRAWDAGRARPVFVKSEA
jgi:uncharacterized protein (DUF1778 family)